MKSSLFHRNVNAAGTEVFAEDGNVTLQGEATSEAQKDLTIEYAKGVEGVKNVNNEMTVLPAAMKPGEKMMGNKKMVDEKTMGEKMDAAVEKDLATKLVSDVHGVKSVKNQMTVQ